MDTTIIRRIKAQLAVATLTLESVHNSSNMEDMSVQISLHDLVALLGVSDSAFKFLEDTSVPEYQERLEMVDHTLSVVGGILVDHHMDKVISTTQKMLDPEPVSKPQSH